MMNKNNSYWENRKAQRMWEYMQSAENTADEISKVYYQSSQYLNQQLSSIFDRYAAKHKLSKFEAKRLLNSLEDPTSYTEMLVKLKAGVSSDEKDELIKMLEAPAYQVRIRRLEDLQKEIDVMVKSIYAQEKNFNTLNYINTSYDAYYKSMYDIQGMTGYKFSFAHLNPMTVDTLLNSKWSGVNYSERIWDNTQLLARDIKEQLLMGVLTGKTEKEMAEDISIKHASSSYKARRLVRTESNYIAEAIEMLSYEECGAKKYTFLATLDLSTSEICREHDMKTYLLKNKEVGVNCPPMHPWCRSTTIIGLDKKTLAKLKRRARDPKTGKSYVIDKNMNYKDWMKQQQEKYGADNVKMFEKKVKNLNADKKQMKRYTDVLGKDKVPKNIEDFQKMKYNKSDQWNAKKREYKTINKINKKETYSNEYRNKLKETYYEFRNNGCELTDHSLNRFLGQKAGKGKFNFTKQDILQNIKNGTNYKEDEKNRLIYFYSNLAVVQNNKTKEIVTFVSRNTNKKGWEKA